MAKRTLEFDLPVYEDERVKEVNKNLGTEFKTFDEAIKDMVVSIYNEVHNVGNEGGWYIGDGIKVKVEIEYEPEDK